jgi:hypothetical protein
MSAPAVMRRLDELFTAWPFLASRRMAVMLRAKGTVNVIFSKRRPGQIYSSASASRLCREHCFSQ